MYPKIPQPPLYFTPKIKNLVLFYVWGRILHSVCHVLRVLRDPTRIATRFHSPHFFVDNKIQQTLMKILPLKYHVRNVIVV